MYEKHLCKWIQRDFELKNLDRDDPNVNIGTKSKNTKKDDMMILIVLEKTPSLKSRGG